MFRSATFKLTMYYLVIIAIISIGFSTVLYQVASNDLAFGLRRQTERISTNFPVFSHSPYLSMDAVLNDGRRHIIGRLLVFNAFVLTAAGFASYALARRTLQPIQASHERQKRFTADVSHELRTPLTALTMESEVALLDTGATKTQLRSVITSNIEEANKLTALVGSLLRLSQLDSLGQATLLHSLPLQTSLAGAVNQVGSVAAANDITILTPKTDLQVRSDETMLTQLFTILLDNAIKYSPSGGSITITAKVHGTTAAISISDQGSGIAKHDLDHVFERFYRADAARSTSQTGGFGLGLSIAKLIADSHQASISLSSSLGKGTTATVYVPLAQTTKQSDAQTTKKRS